MPRSRCSVEGCLDLSMSRSALDRALGSRFVGGLCKVHTMRSAVLDRASQDRLATRHGRAMVPVEPYRDWLREVLASGTLSYQGLTLTDLRRPQLAALLGIHSVTVSNVANGHTVYAKPPLVRALSPFMALCSTRQRWAVEVGQTLQNSTAARYVPLGTGVVDRYGRMWQLRDPGWCPAHDPGLSRYAHQPMLGMRYPVRVVHLPPALQTCATP